MNKALLLFCPLLWLAGCSDGKYSDAGKTVFRYNESSNITSLDPAYAKDQANIWAVYQLYNGLVQLDNQLRVVPCIASSWEILNSGREYRFHLRRDVFFHDNACFKDGKGRRVSPKDFIYSFNRIIDKNTASPGSWVFNPVSKQNNHYSFSSPDDSTLIIALDKPFPPFLGLLSTVYCSVIPEEGIRKYGQEFRKNPVGTGPFYFQIWKEGSKLVLLKNKHYFETEGEQRLPFLDAVAITFLPDKQSAFLEFMKGRLDFLSGLDVSYKDELLTKKGTLNPKYIGRINLVSQPYLNTEYLGFMMDPGKNSSFRNPLQEKMIRQAVNYAFDRRKMVEYLRNNIGMPGTAGIIPPGLPSFDTSLTCYDYQPEKARNILKSAGLNKNGEIIEITLSTTADYLDICKYIQHQVEEVGLKLNITIQQPAALKEMKSQSKVPFFRASWIADYPDAENYLSLFYSRNFCPIGPNYTHYSSGEFDKLYEKALETVNDSLRYDYYRKMEKIMMEEAPVVILYYDQVLRFIHSNVKGLESDAMNMLKLKRARKV
ncbi:MAG: ABC transporter substrate-binding protein [Bacteroidota bacterium]